MIPESMRRLIAPNVPKRHARIHVSDGLFPIVHPVPRFTLNPAASGKAHESRVQILDGSGKIGTQAMVFPRLLWQQRNHIEKQGPLTCSAELKPRRGVLVLG